jgi:hypothetical protein
MLLLGRVVWSEREKIRGRRRNIQPLTGGVRYPTPELVSQGTVITGNLGQARDLYVSSAPLLILRRRCPTLDAQWVAAELDCALRRRRGAICGGPERARQGSLQPPHAADNSEIQDP